MLRRLHVLKDFSDLMQPALTDFSNRVILKAKSFKSKADTSSTAYMKVRKASADVASTSVAAQQGGETSHCNGDIATEQSTCNGKGTD